jgi:hypothetical protein
MLRGLGVAMGLPLLDAMLPSGGLIQTAQAATGPAAAGGIAGRAAVAPVRSCFVFIPNGVNVDNWFPKAEGAAFELPPTLAPLAKLKSDISVLSGLALDGAKAHGDGPGDHARSAAAFLTGAHPYKTKGKDIKLGVSVDQFLAEKVGDRTRLPSLEVGLDRAQTAGDCDSGYSCAYVTNISWRNDTTPVPKEVDPGALFDRLFGNNNGTSKEALEAQAKRLRLRKSVLDFVSEDTRRLERQVGAADKQKLDEFTTSIREVEKRVESARTAAAAGAQQAIKPDMARPDGTPKDFAEHYKLMADLLVLAWRMDLTRVSTLMVARDGSNKTYRELGLTEGHHTCSHHGKDEAKIAAIKKIDLFHMEQFAYFVQKLKETKEGNGSMLDNSMVMLGSGISDGDRHNHNELPVLVAGRGGGAIKPGRHTRYPRETPLCNLYVSMLGAMGVKTTSFGDSTGPLTGLNG